MEKIIDIGKDTIEQFTVRLKDNTGREWFLSVTYVNGQHGRTEPLSICKEEFMGLHTDEKQLINTFAQQQIEKHMTLIYAEDSHMPIFP